MTDILTSKEIRFKYIIITSNTDSFNSTRKSMFNQIPMQVINTLKSLIVISHLPATLKEYLAKWPLSCCNYTKDSYYDITYINESRIDEGFYEYISNLRYGAIFVNDELEKSLVDQICKNTDLITINTDEEKIENVHNLSEKIIKIIYDDFYNKTLKVVRSWPKEIQEQVTLHKNIDTNNKSYIAPSAKYLDPLTNAVDRIRGLYQSKGAGILKISPVSPEVHSDYELMADHELQKALKTIISEKFLLLMFGFILEESFDDRDLEMITELGIIKEDLLMYLEEPNAELYLKLSNTIYEQLDKLKFTTDMTLCIPSVNYEYIRYFFSKDTLGRDYRKLSKEAFRLNFDMSTYYGLLNPAVFRKGSEEDRLNDINFAIFLLGERGAEVTFLSLLHVFLTLSHKNPFIRTRNIPGSQIWRDLKRLLEIVERNDI